MQRKADRSADRKTVAGKSEAVPWRKKEQETRQILGRVWSPKVEHSSDTDDDNVNWGHFCGTACLINVIFLGWLAHRINKKLFQTSQLFSRSWAVKWENWDHFIKSYLCLQTIRSSPPLPIIISTGCQVANTMSLICCELHSITPFSPRREEQTVALTVVSQHL